jgi:hypothetical protein
VYTFRLLFDDCSADLQVQQPTPLVQILKSLPYLQSAHMLSHHAPTKARFTL